MNLLYMVGCDPLENSGVATKIRQQGRVWSSLGVNVYYLTLDSMTLYDAGFKKIYCQRAFRFPVRSKPGRILNFLSGGFFLKKIVRMINFDLIYMRFQLYSPALVNILNKHLVVMEVNSNDLSEMRIRSKVAYFYNKLTRDFLLKRIDAFVCVSHELGEMIEGYGKPISIISNGIDVNSYIPCVTKNTNPHLVFVGSPGQSWHGVDKIAKLADYFLDWEFHVIGFDGDNTRNLLFYGYLPEDQVVKIISECDVGIGTLALHRKQMEEASPLKTRLYLALGLPLIYAYKDTDFIGDEAFGLVLANKEENLDLVRIEKFVSCAHNNSGLRSAARHFAKNNLDYIHKERIRISFFRDVLDDIDS